MYIKTCRSDRQTGGRDKAHAKTSRTKSCRQVLWQVSQTILRQSSAKPPYKLQSYIKTSHSTTPSLTTSHLKPVSASPPTTPQMCYTLLATCPTCAFPLRTQHVLCAHAALHGFAPAACPNRMRRRRMRGGSGGCGMCGLRRGSLSCWPQSQSQSQSQLQPR